jgi:hypothetical protein
MKIVYNTILPIGKGKIAITLYPYIFVKRKYIKLFTKKALNHELIHEAQIKELGLIRFYIMYLWFFVKGGYKRANPFELEAYAHDDDLDYLSFRVKNAWRFYL